MIYHEVPLDTTHPFCVRANRWLSKTWQNARRDNKVLPKFGVKPCYIIS